VGGDHEACTQDGRCKDGLTCTDNDRACDRYGLRCCLATGSVDQPCRQEDGSCNAGLECFMDVRNCSTDDFYCCLAAGGAGQRCHRNGSCDGALACVTGPACELDDSGYYSRCCAAAGGATQPCLPDGTCNDATLSCVTRQNHKESWRICEVTGS
jgi:hypothetical protein